MKKIRKNIPKNSPIKKKAITQCKNRLNSFDSLNWLKKRYQRTAKVQYLKTRLEIEEDQEIEDVFQKIDYDKSGKIDVKELHHMFLSNGIEMNR